MIFFPDTFCKSVQRKPTPRDFFIGLLTVFNTPHSLKLGIVHNCQKMIKQIIVTLINNPAQKISYFRNERREAQNGRSEINFWQSFVLFAILQL